MVKCPNHLSLLLLHNRAAPAGEHRAQDPAKTHTWPPATSPSHSIFLIGSEQQSVPQLLKGPLKKVTQVGKTRMCMYMHEQAELCCLKIQVAGCKQGAECRRLAGHAAPLLTLSLG